MFTVVIFTIAGIWKQPRYPLTDKWKKKMWCIYTVRYYWAIKRNEIGSLVVMQMTLLLLRLSRFSRVWLRATPETAAHQAPPSRDSPGKNTGVGCHFLLQCMKVESESEVTQSCLTLSDPMDCSPPGSSVHGIFQARVLEWGAIAFSA